MEEDVQVNRRDHLIGYRSDTGDALFGAVQALEATLGVLIARLGVAAPAELMVLREEVEARLSDRQIDSRYGSGREAISDGLNDSLDAIFGAASESGGLQAPEKRPRTAALSQIE